MKHLLILLLLISCGTRTKTKTTDKVETKTEINDKTNVNTKVETEVKAKIEVKDKVKTEVKTEAMALQSIQNLSLKNSGKCQDPGAVRYLSYTDKNGSKMEIPVDNNTELNFGNESNFKQENQILKSENETLKTENTSLSTRFKEVLNQNKTLSENVEILQKSNHIISDKKGIWFFSMGVATGIVVILGLILIKWKLWN